MPITRRTFTRGALSVGLASQLAAPALAQDPKLAGALAAIRAYAQRHLDHFRLPGLTLGVTTPAGFSTVMNFGFANAEARTPITPDTLFQIGSISKLTTAALLHQFAAEGKFRLTDRLSDLLPSIPSRRATPSRSSTCSITSPAFRRCPVFPVGGLWTAYAPGAHWRYSNTAYRDPRQAGRAFRRRADRARRREAAVHAARNEPHARSDYRCRSDPVRAGLRGGGRIAVRAWRAAPSRRLGRRDLRRRRGRLHRRRHDAPASLG